MESERMLIDLYKRHQYELTRDKIQGLVMLMSAVGMALGAVLSLVLVAQPVSALLYAGALVLITAVYLLQKYKVISRNTASLIHFCYLCFIYTPVNWYVAGGVTETTPFVSAIVMLALIIAFSGKTQRRLHFAYLAVIFALTVYSNVVVSSADFSATLYKSVAFMAAILLTTYYMLFMLKKYDQMHNQFLRGSIKDELTRVLSRRVLDVVISHAESLYRSKGQDYIVIMMDIDKFKHLNDKYGHVVGDIVLRNTAVCIKKNMREEDFVIRYGGDEFLVVLLDGSIDNAQSIIERIDEAEKCKRLLDFHISVSRGLVKRSEGTTPEDVIALADKRMYEDKQN